MRILLNRVALAALIVSAVFALAAARAPAQTTLQLDPRAPELTRDELAELLERLEEASVPSSGYSRVVREQAAREAAYIRGRLEAGDFGVGDRVVLEVQGEPQLSDTLIVSGQRAIDLPEIGAVSLLGVLRSELEDHLRRELGRYLRDPQIRAHGLIRIAVLGAVTSPGFYNVPASLLLEDAIMAAGGPADGADVGAVVIQRGDELLWDQDIIQQAMVEGRTLDQLSMQAGDRIVVPQRTPGFFEGGLLRTLLVTIPPVVYLLTLLFD